MKTIKFIFEREDDAHDMCHNSTIRDMAARKEINISYNNMHPNELIINFNEPFEKRVFEAVYDLAHYYCFYN